MKKRVISIITFVLLNLIAINNVFAVATTNAKLNVSTSAGQKHEKNKERLMRLVNKRFD